MSKIIICNLLFIIIFISKSKEETDIDAIISFDLSDPDITISNHNDFKEIKDKLNKTILLPKATLTKSGYNFIGWTPDFIYGYEPGDVFYIQDEKVLMKPLFEDKNDKNMYILSYYIEIDGEVVDASVDLPTKKYKQNSLIKVSAIYFYCETKSHLGYQYDGHVFVQREKLVMPNNDVTLTPKWYNIHTITFYPGDLEGVVDRNYYETFKDYETHHRELPEPSRFSRKGYEIVAWHCEYDGKDYPPYFTYTVPDSEVDFYAVWEPHEYKILFSTGVKGIENIKIPAKTGEIIIIPEIGGDREGYIFKGWKDNDKIYLPGEEYIVKGALPGLGIGLDAIWEEQE